MLALGPTVWFRLFPGSPFFQPPGGRGPRRPAPPHPQRISAGGCMEGDRGQFPQIYCHLCLSFGFCVHARILKQPGDYKSISRRLDAPWSAPRPPGAARGSGAGRKMPCRCGSQKEELPGRSETLSTAQHDEQGCSWAAALRVAEAPWPPPGSAGSESAAGRIGTV